MSAHKKDPARPDLPEAAADLSAAPWPEGDPDVIYIEADEDEDPGSVSEMDTNSNETRKEAVEAHDTQDAIFVDTDGDPQLNPSSPEFNIKKYREYLSTLDLSDLERRITRAVSRANDAAAAAAKEITQSGIVPRALEDSALASLKEITAISEWATKAAAQVLTPQLKKLFDETGSNAAFNWKSFIAALQAGERRIEALEPFLKKELPTIRKTPGLENVSLDDLISYIALDGQTIPEDSENEKVPPAIREGLQRAIEAARAAMPKTKAKRADIVTYPLDKVNANIWGLLKEPTGRQLKMLVNTAKSGSPDRLNVYYSIDFSNLEKQGIQITKKLTPFDKRVYIAISALYNAGNTVISLTQIHYAMGNTVRPSNALLEKIQNSITKMRGADIFVDNILESQAYNYARFRYEGPLLPLERVTASVNGKIADAAIHIFREPPVMSFAKDRKQITTITVKVLQSPISKTDANLLIDDYLIERIGRAKRSGQSFKILYDTLYEHAQITTYKQKTRAPEKIKTYLDHYQSCGLIKSYAMKKDGIQISF